MVAAELRKQIGEKIPDGTVVPRHTERAHFYEVVPLGKTFPSVTAKLQVLKDEGLTNYKMNRALDYVFANWQKFNPENVMEHLDYASKASEEILEDAGDIGRNVHRYREDYFKKWIELGARPAIRPVGFIPEDQHDVRAVSAMRALEKFVQETNYEPVICEQLVYDEYFQVAGTLDDIGIMDVNGKRELVLMDLKTSNQFKDHYFFQVAMYYMMFRKLTGLKPTRCFILKVSKEDGTYKIEDLFKKQSEMLKLVNTAKLMLKMNAGIDFIKSLRKDNQKKVIEL